MTTAEHLPLPPGDEGCLEILSDRLRSSPGVVALEANFRDNTLTVRYQPARVEPDQLNALADEIGSLFAQRVTYCERREALGSCAECALRLGRVRQEEMARSRAPAGRRRVGLALRGVPPAPAELTRPLSRAKPWGAPFSPAEEAQYAKGRAMAMLTGACLLLLVLGMALERGGL